MELSKVLLETYVRDGLFALLIRGLLLFLFVVIRSCMVYSNIGHVFCDLFDYLYLVGVHVTSLWQHDSLRVSLSS